MWQRREFVDPLAIGLAQRLRQSRPCLQVVGYTLSNSFVTSNSFVLTGHFPACTTSDSLETLSADSSSRNAGSRRASEVEVLLLLRCAMDNRLSRVGCHIDTSRCRFQSNALRCPLTRSLEGHCDLWDNGGRGGIQIVQHTALPCTPVWVQNGSRGDLGASGEFGGAWFFKKKTKRPLKHSGKGYLRRVWPSHATVLHCKHTKDRDWSDTLHCARIRAAQVFFNVNPPRPNAKISKRA